MLAGEMPSGDMTGKSSGTLGEMPARSVRRGYGASGAKDRRRRRRRSAKRLCREERGGSSSRRETFAGVILRDMIARRI